MSNVKTRHYSYECKVQLQERPYNPRPSRTQQLLNPKLVPKLTNDTPDDATRKKGVADEELAKKEAERARKRELEDDDEPSAREPEFKRQRSSSVDSVSSISTRSSKSPPPRRRASPSPRQTQDLSPPARRPRRNHVPVDDKNPLTVVSVPVRGEDLVTTLLKETHARLCVKHVALLYLTMRDQRLDDSRGTAHGRRADRIPGIDAVQKKVAIGSTGIGTRGVVDIEVLHQNLSHRESAV
ncbi:hypothetical protein INS49_013046 [Diaporthe citri]|uniref:uncharacterized protein n=1 Tax=Diaporthe citri TaxID=83186 RepID=UPI001C7E2F3E|nr:uncharacterized protein INS49_013046 [Diaporthe citri]KAG6359525.1 hypothetical protein INS49_013046 [Diaporthe citri]